MHSLSSTVCGLNARRRQSQDGEIEQYDDNAPPCNMVQVTRDSTNVVSAKCQIADYDSRSVLWQI